MKRCEATVSDDLPIYTVLVPLFRETEVVKKLLESLSALDYPVEKLDIKILLEATDIEMQVYFERLVLPSHFEVIIVPQGKPQTKPRALNYGLLFARGTYLVIYDAEDIPEPQQIKLAAQQFASLPKDVSCLQAQLTYFNARENWLTRQFTMEYSILFDAILPVLSAAKLPILLGGTSNHFRIKDLIDVGAWDPFNVTEDADLGLRLHRSGKRTVWLNSNTYEEAVSDFGSWTKQRSRWLKGFLQTWFVHMRQPSRLLRELSLPGFWIFQCMTIGVFLTALLHPLFLIHMIFRFLIRDSSVDSFELNLDVYDAISFFVFAGGYLCTMLLAARTGMLRFGVVDWFAVITMPLYWLCAFPAAVLALYDFIKHPHDWRKTSHGRTKLANPSLL